MKIKGLLILISILIVLILAGFIGSHNSELVRINYLIAQTDIKISVLLAFTFLIGFLFGLLLLLPYLLRLKWQIKMLNRKHKKLAQGSTIS
jgi:putative membrane protein